MSTVMDTVPARAVTSASTTWLVVLGLSVLDLRPEYRLRDLESGATWRRQFGGLGPAGAFAAAGDAGPRGGQRRRRGVRPRSRRPRPRSTPTSPSSTRTSAPPPACPARSRPSSDTWSTARQERRPGDRQRTARCWAWPATPTASPAAFRSCRRAWTKWCARCRPPARRPRRSTSPCARWCCRATMARRVTEIRAGGSGAALAGDALGRDAARVRQRAGRPAQGRRRLRRDPARQHQRAGRARPRPTRCGWK